MFEREVSHHVLPLHRHPQPQERDLQQLQTQKGKAAGQDLSLTFAFFIPVWKDLPLFFKLTTVHMPDDFGFGHMKL